MPASPFAGFYMSCSVCSSERLSDLPRVTEIGHGWARTGSKIWKSETRIPSLKLLLHRAVSVKSGGHRNECHEYRWMNKTGRMPNGYFPEICEISSNWFKAIVSASVRDNERFLLTKEMHLSHLGRKDWDRKKSGFRVRSSGVSSSHIPSPAPFELAL